MTGPTIDESKIVHQLAEARATSLARPPCTIRPWSWSRLKWCALRRVLAGWTDVATAEQLGVSRNTIRAWRRHPTFHAEAVRRVRDHAATIRLRRMWQSGVLLDRLTGLVAQSLIKLDKGDALTRTEIGALITFLSEYRAMRELERGDFADIANAIESAGQ